MDRCRPTGAPKPAPASARRVDGEATELAGDPAPVEVFRTHWEDDQTRGASLSQRRTPRPVVLLRHYSAHCGGVDLRARGHALASLLTIKVRSTSTARFAVAMMRSDRRGGRWLISTT